MGKEGTAKMSVYKPTAKMLADAAGVGMDSVYSYRKGRRPKGVAAKKLAIAEEMLADGTNKLIEAVKQAVKF